jgi:succinate dehydrogenase / fumarate reductase cytochrome b subunit
MEAKLQNKRPKHLNLFKIKQPLPAVISILHRVSGALLFFPGIPLLLCSLQMLLESEQGFDALRDYLHNPMIKVMLLLPIWFFSHHLFAGIRHLASGFAYRHDADAGTHTSSLLVVAMGVLLTVLIGMLLW